MATTKKSKTTKKTVAKKPSPKVKKTATVKKTLNNAAPSKVKKAVPAKKVVKTSSPKGKASPAKKVAAKKTTAKAKTAVAKKVAVKKTAAKAIMAAPAKSITPMKETPKAVVPVQKKQSAIQAVKEAKPVKEETKKDISFNPKEMEPRWQKKWEADKLYRSVIDESKRRQAIRLEGELPSPANPPSGCHFHPRCAQASDECRKVFPEQSMVDEGHVVVCHLYRRP